MFKMLISGSAQSRLYLNYMLYSLLMFDSLNVCTARVIFRQACLSKLYIVITITNFTLIVLFYY